MVTGPCDVFLSVMVIGLLIMSVNNDVMMTGPGYVCLSGSLNRMTMVPALSPRQQSWRAS